MPKIYLSPSTQEYNPYYGGGSEEYYMNLVADAMEKYLNASGIEFDRNTKDMTASSSIRQSNAGNYDFHIALHSNASAGANAGRARGAQVYYYSYSQNGSRAAEIIADNLRLIYPDPERVSTVATSSLGEVARTRAPAALIEYAFHDNPSDADWIRSNIDNIAKYTVMALCEYFGIPFNPPEGVKYGVVVTQSGGAVNLRAEPSVYSEIIAAVPTGARLAVYAERQGWYVVNYNGVDGYINGEYLRVE